MSVEIQNLVDSMVSFVGGGANPIAVIDQTSNIESVEYISTGTYRVTLKSKIPTGAYTAPGSIIRAQTNQASDGTAYAVEDALAPGDVSVTTRNTAGTLANLGGRIDVTIFRYPNRA